jgi:hypothetical protein
MPRRNASVPFYPPQFNRLNIEPWAELQYWGGRPNTQMNYNPSNQDPLDIIKESFQEYLSNNGGVQNSTLGIEINYLQDERDRIPKTIFLIKRIYSNEQEQLLEIRQERNHYLNTSDFFSGCTIDDQQINEIINRLRESYKILQIMLCEVYNDDTDLRRRREEIIRALGDREYRGGYYPYTVPIKLLYRNIEGFIEPVEQPQRRNILPDEFTTGPINYMEQRNQRLLDSVEARSDELAEAQRRRQAGEEPDAGDFPQLDEYERPSEYTPYPLSIVGGNQSEEILDKPMSSYVYPGMCILCLETDHDGLCRVDCTAGHIFHCDCISEYRNTYTAYGWNNNCPVCHESIQTMAHVPQNTELPNSFGKSRCKKCKPRKKCPTCAMKVLRAQLKMAKEFAMRGGFQQVTHQPFTGSKEPQKERETSDLPRPPPPPPPPKAPPKAPPKPPPGPQRPSSNYMDQLKQVLAARGEVGFGKKKMDSEERYLRSIK